MCTVSWLHQDDGYQLLCNRDERRSRLGAAPPRITHAGRARVLAPRDGAAGGSWIAVNDFGVSVCLLNGANLSGESDCAGYRVPAVMMRSRGTLLMELADADGVDEVCLRLERMELAAFAPFTVVALEPGLPAAIVEWNGQEKAVLLHGDPFSPLASSSVDPAGARERRQREFARLTDSGRRLTASSLYAFHESHGGHADARSPCMHRRDAATVSFSWITVTRDSADFFYTPGAPCELRPGATTRLARAG